MATATISFQRPRPTSNGMPVSEGSDIPLMRPRTGKRGTDEEMVKLLRSALDNLAESNCCFFACEGPKRVIGMATCVKCYAMREIATVLASLEMRNQSRDSCI